ncbi:lipid II flippase Amj family protein [Cytobacillus horneckiae]|uniref:Lipid II flippase Amj n=1 Tax=Cytobacillus horneckiae TaxID=549687 RepID=A0A2N0ZMK8_9BACI|nr:lipid II flippase Amj family protein [Cytobacillus horneckiae]MEC1159146.1 lipid II flippase Amj family protein [Cytobacillus horneckiae]MED2938838.1 lipid II flippase Amj family protein [Cytobacillus horneckiae]PKG30748.1 DUF2837 domain-containing protein [Cytobacillus horneckiae]
MELITLKLILIALFILLIHSVETLAYAVRLSGARVKLLASALSLFNTIVIVSRMSNMIQQPFTGSLVDTAPEGSVEFVQGFLADQYRVLIGASTVGTLIGAMLLPTFVAIFSRAIIQLSVEMGSVPALIKKGFTPYYIKRTFSLFRKPNISFLKGLERKHIPMRLFFINMAVTSIYTIGVLSALYASVIAPEYQTTAIMASGLINGVATILLSTLVDPKISVLADAVINGKGSYNYLKGASVTMVTSRLFGTIFAQLLFIPGAIYIAWAAKFVVMLK